MGGCLSVLCPKNQATVRKEDSDRQKLNGQVSNSARGTGTDGGGGQQNPGFVPDADKERVNEGTGFMCKAFPAIKINETHAVERRSTRGTLEYTGLTHQNYPGSNLSCDFWVSTRAILVDFEGIKGSLLFTYQLP